MLTLVMQTQHLKYWHEASWPGLCTIWANFFIKANQFFKNTYFKSAMWSQCIDKDWAITSLILIIVIVNKHVTFMTRSMYCRLEPAIVVATMVACSPSLPYCDHWPMISKLNYLTNHGVPPYLVVTIGQ